MLLKATRRSFLTSCSNINEKLIVKYLNPSLATAKEYMKKPLHGIRSTTPKMITMGIAPIPVVHILLPHVLPLFQQPPPYQGPAYGTLQGPNLIGMDGNESIANVFCFGEFVDKNNEVVYNNLMGSFLFISLDGRVCLYALYHSKTNAISIMPIASLDIISIFKCIQNATQGPHLKRVQAKNKHHGQPSNQARLSIPHGTTMQVTTR